MLNTIVERQQTNVFSENKKVACCDLQCIYVHVAKRNFFFSFYTDKKLGNITSDKWFIDWRIVLNYSTMSKDRNVRHILWIINFTLLPRVVTLNFRVNFTNQACGLFNKDNAELKRVSKNINDTSIQGRPK